jgi:hypothetical protein
MANKDKRFELVYSNQRTGYEAGRRYANPRFFSTPRAGVSKVIVIGDWPKVVDAYTKLGIPVVVAQNPSDLAKGGRKAVPKPPTTPETPNARPEPTVPETAYLRTAEPRAEQEAVEIPDNWRDLPWPQRKSLASRVTDTPVVNGEIANRAIEEELQRRS